MSFETEFFRSLLDDFYDGVYFVDRNRTITYWNAAAARITGYAADEAVGISCADNLLQHVGRDGTLLCLNGCPVSATLVDGEKREADVFLHHRDGHRVPVTVRVVPIRDPDGVIIGAVEVFSDSSTKMEALQRVQELEQTAFHDALTGVANRALTEITLRARHDELRRYGWPYGVLFADIDHFKQVNDTYGHETGDRVLQMVSRTVQGVVRSSDLVGRWGGEELVVVVVNIDAEKLRITGERLLQLVRVSRLDLESVSVAVTVSLGAALARPGETPADVVRRTDQLMYRSKRDGRDRLSSDAE
ncbi:MAG TPA: diguanylate cyclase [Thermoanaerobaculaceae bacterium]|nr:diguanylate cyclase [Thermoanaerobaculaceae bacterium]